jgi:hypothetical protein
MDADIQTHAQCRVSRMCKAQRPVGTAGEATGGGSCWPPTSIKCRGQGRMQLKNCGWATLNLRLMDCFIITSRTIVYATGGVKM